MNTPNLMLIGAAKSGTTTLADLLNQNDNIFVPKHKEVHFFDSSHNYAKGIEYYRKQFLTEKEYHYKCDATPAYLANPEIVIKRINDSMPASKLKFIVILRNPIDRAWSHYNHIVRARGEEETFLNTISNSYVNNCYSNPELWKNYYHDGLYSNQLKEWFESFGRNNFHIIFFEDFITNSKKELHKIEEFLCLETEDYSLNNSKKNTMSVSKSITLRNILNNTGALRSLSRMIIPNRKFRQACISRLKLINRKNLSNDERMNLSNKDRLVIREFYAESVRDLSLLLDIDLKSIWKDFQ